MAISSHGGRPVFGFLKTAVPAAMVSLAPAVMAVRPVSEANPGD